MGWVDVDVKAVNSKYPHGEFVAVLSKPTTDRDNEVVAAKAFEPLPDHITIDVDHALKTAGVVGSGEPYYDGDTLMVKGRFASTPLAQEVRALVTEGHIRTMSVAFRQAEKEEAKDGVTVIKKAELLNAAFVAIPANRDAVVLSAKAADGETKDAISPHSTETTDAAWDNNENKTNLSNDAGGDTYRKAFAWIDSGADPDLKGSYRFIHHMVSADGTVGAANLTACSTGIGVLNGGRGGTVIPDSGRRGVWAHLAKHLRDAGREPPELKALLDAEVKQGRTLSAENEQRVRQIAQLAQELLDGLTSEERQESEEETAEGESGKGAADEERRHLAELVRLFLTV